MRAVFLSGILAINIIVLLDIIFKDGYSIN